MGQQTCGCGSDRLALVGRKLSSGIGVNVYRCLNCEGVACNLDPRPPTWISAVARHVAAVQAEIIEAAYSPRLPGA
jgi:hypothetical protein